MADLDARHVHYAHIFSSSMGTHLTNTSCGISESYFEGGFHFESPELAMKGKGPGHKGWWSDEPVHVDCPKCIPKMVDSLRARCVEAEKNLEIVENQIAQLSGQFRVAKAKADALAGVTG